MKDEVEENVMVNLPVLLALVYLNQRSTFRGSLLSTKPKIDLFAMTKAHLGNVELDWSPILSQIRSKLNCNWPSVAVQEIARPGS
jgi:hypothetical protein